MSDTEEGDDERELADDQTTLFDYEHDYRYAVENPLND